MKDNDLTRWFNKKYPKTKRFSLETEIVAERLGISASRVRSIKSEYKERFQEGIHFHVRETDTNKGIRSKTMWFIEGINELTDIIRTDEAREHRKLTTIDPNRLLNRLSALIKEELEPVPQLVQDVEELKTKIISPIDYDRLIKILADKRVELHNLGWEWWEVHEVAKGWTGLAKYRHMNFGQVEEAIKRVDEKIKKGKKD